MSLIDKIEEYGAAVDAHLMTRADAARSLALESGGGLTEHGAADMIDRWQSARSEYTESP